jgi:teichoic acid transport system permease protein
VPSRGFDSPTRAVEAPPTFQPLQLQADSAALHALAQYNRLHRMNTRQPLGRYIGSLWRRRSFIWTLARSKVYAKNRKNYLGQLWNVLTPFLNALVLVFIFGFILRVSRGLGNPASFIVVGSMTFTFFDRAVLIASSSIRNNMSLVRSVRFPRAVLPISQVLTELIAMLPAFVVMCLVAWGCSLLPDTTPVMPTWRWLLLPAALFPLLLFTIGCSLIVTRWVTAAPDVHNIVNFLMRFLMFASGVMFPIPYRLAELSWVPDWMLIVLTHQPLACYLDMVRACILSEPSIPFNRDMWLLGISWAVLALVIGFVYFWRAEHRYGIN